MLLGMELWLDPSDLVLDGDPAPPPKKGGRALSQYLSHVYCARTAGWIKMPLGMEVGLDPSDIVLAGDLAPPPPKKVAHPRSRIFFVVAKQLDGSRYHLVRW